MLALTSPARTAIVQALNLLEDPANIEEARTVLRQLIEIPAETLAILKRGPIELTPAQHAELDADSEVQAMLRSIADGTADEEAYYEANPDGSPSDRLIS